MERIVANEERAEMIAEVVKAIAHPVRLRIIAMLCQGDQRVIAMAEQLDKTQSAISQQLRILRMSGLVNVVKQNGVANYALAQPRLKELLTCLDGCQAA